MTPAEMDRLAAEKIMGYGWCKFPAGWVEKNRKAFVYKWSPTTNEQNAAMVRDEMLKNGWKLKALSGPFDMHSVGFKRGSEKAHYMAVAFTYALTAAALLAVGAVTEEEIANGSN